MQLKILFITLLFSQLVFANDTIKPVSYSDTCALDGAIPKLVTYKTQLGGYICGNSVLNTPEKAQKYYWSDSAKTLTAVAFWFGQKMQAPFPGLIKAKVYRVNPSTGAPAALLAESSMYSVGNIDTSDNLTVLNFSSPVMLPDTFFVALDLTLLSPGDSIGLLSTRDGCYSGEQLAWEKDSTGVWVPFNDGTSITSWGLDIDMAIFPVGDFGLHTTVEPIDESPAKVFPNPASDKIIIELQNENAFLIRVADMQGKFVYENNFLPREQRIELNTINFTPGIYFLEITSAKKTSAQKIIIAR